MMEPKIQFFLNSGKKKEQLISKWGAWFVLSQVVCCIPCIYSSAHLIPSATEGGIPHYSTQLEPALNYTALYCTLLHSTALYCILLHSTALYCTLLYSTVLYFTLLHSTALNSLI